MDMDLQQRANAAMSEARELRRRLEESIARGRFLLVSCKQSDLEMEKAMWAKARGLPAQEE